MARKFATSSFDPARRPGGNTRRLIAERTARLIIEGGITDWTSAKRKAARQLGLEDARALPDHEEIAAALRSQQALFHPEDHAEQLRAKRKEALEWMRRFSDYSPALVGGVADGWGTRETEIRIELSADSAKELEFALLRAGIPYRHLAEDSAALSADFGVEGRQGPLRLMLRTAQQRRAGPVSPGAIRLNISELEQLLREA